MYPVGAWVSHPVHICPWIMVISNSHEHCIYVRDFGVGQILVFTTPASPQLLSFFANAGWLPQNLSCLVVCFPSISITDNLSSIVVFLNASLFTLYPMFVGTLAGDSSVNFLHLFTQSWCLQSFPFSTCCNLKLSTELLRLTNLTGCPPFLYFLNYKQVCSIIPLFSWNKY